MRGYLPGLTISFLFFLLQIFTLSDYGMHEDSPFHFLRGQAYLQKILTGSARFDFSNRPSPVLFIPGQRISLYKPNASEEVLAPIRPFGSLDETRPTLQQEFKGVLARLNRGESFYKHNAWSTNIWDLPINRGHPAVSDILMAATNRLFYEKLGLLPDIEAYHFYVVFVSSLSLFFVYLFSKRAFDTTTAFFATATLALFPFYFAEGHFNIKDPVQMSFFTGATVCFYFWVRSKFSLKKFIFFLFFVFLALGTKWNIAFLPLIIIPWLFFIRKKEEVAYFLSWRHLFLYGSLALVVPFILLILAWPFLWSDPLPKLANTFNFYSTLAAKDIRVDIPSAFPLPLGFDTQASLRVVFTTPPVILLLFSIGLITILLKLTKTNFRENLLLLLWLTIPILRVSRQETEILGSIRNFMEYLPAFTIITGIGASFVSSKLTRIFPKIGPPYVTATIFILYVIILSYTLVKTHPNQNIYYNLSVGGIAGAKSSQLYNWQSSYDNVYRQGVDWFNKNAPQKAELAYLDGTMLAISPLWLRDDIHFGSYFSGFEKKGEYVISLVYPVAPAVFGYNYLERFLKPIYTLSVDGVAVLKIWQNDQKYTKAEFSQQIQSEKNLLVKRSMLEQRKIWEINFDTSQKVTRLILQLPQNCPETKGVWSAIHKGRENFINPQQLLLGKGKIEIDFPAEEAETLRFWDVEGNSCLYQAEVEALFIL